MFLLIWERKWERDWERETATIKVRNIHPLAAYCMPPLGMEPNIQTCALNVNQSRDLLVHRTMPNQLSHTSKGKAVISWGYPLYEFEIGQCELHLDSQLFPPTENKGLTTYEVTKQINWIFSFCFKDICHCLYSAFIPHSQFSFITISWFSCVLSHFQLLLLKVEFQ